MKIWTILIALFLYPVIKDYRLDYGKWQQKRHAMKFRDLFEEKNLKNFSKMWQPWKIAEIQIKSLTHDNFRILTSVRSFFFFMADITRIFKHFYFFWGQHSSLRRILDALFSSSAHSYDKCRNLPDIFTRLTGDLLA